MLELGSRPLFALTSAPVSAVGISCQLAPDVGGRPMYMISRVDVEKALLLVFEMQLEKSSCSMAWPSK